MGNPFIWQVAFTGALAAAAAFALLLWLEIGHTRHLKRERRRARAEYLNLWNETLVLRDRLSAGGRTRAEARRDEERRRMAETTNRLREGR